MKTAEFVAELSILLIEGPQDKKAAVDLYYGKYIDGFGAGSSVEAHLKSFLAWIEKTLPDLASTRYRKTVDLYGLIGAIKQASDAGLSLSRIGGARARRVLDDFEKKTKHKELTGDAARYVIAASRQTDNLIPRTTRIEILAKLLRAA